MSGMVRVLGRVEIQAQGGENLPITSIRSKELIAALGNRPGHPVERRQVMSWIWPDKDPDKARRALNTEVWRLKKVVETAGTDPSALIDSTPRTLTLRNDAGYIVDIDMLAQGGNTALESLLAGEIQIGRFAEGVEAEWVEELRHETQARIFRFLKKTIEAALETNRLAEARWVAEKFQRDNPYDEAATRWLMKIDMMSGQNGNAIQHFNILKTVLSDELGVVPSPDTVALAQKLQSADLPVPRPGFRFEPATDPRIRAALRRVDALHGLVSELRLELSALTDELDRLDE